MYRFQPADHVFGSVEDFPENKCYCPDGNCPLKGVFNVSLCQFSKLDGIEIYILMMVMIFTLYLILYRFSRISVLASLSQR